jgi:DNA-directed RNA polymerase subunit L
MKVSHVRTEKKVFKFTLSGVDVSIANAVRRTILADVPVCGINADSKVDGDCVVYANTSRLHNEILKHRLTCIPVFVEADNIDAFVEKYELFIDVENTGDAPIIVTTENFVVREKGGGAALSRDETAKVFPPNERTNYYIDFSRLRPRVSETIPGEVLRLVSAFSRETARNNAVYNAVCCCTYANTPDPAAVAARWSELEAGYVAAEMAAADIELQRKDFLALDAQRCFVPGSFDFSVETACAHDNIEIVRIACDVLAAHYDDFVNRIDASEVPITASAAAMPNCFDITLQGEDHTTGKPLELAMYETLYLNAGVLSYCGFKKFHPHDTYSVLRLAFAEPISPAGVAAHLKTAAIACGGVFRDLGGIFKKH